jgi:hypothetical protein
MGFSGLVGVVVNNNFTRKALFYSPDFGEGIGKYTVFIGYIKPLPTAVGRVRRLYRDG